MFALARVAFSIVFRVWEPTQLLSSSVGVACRCYAIMLPVANLASIPSTSSSSLSSSSSCSASEQSRVILLISRLGCDDIVGVWAGVALPKTLCDLHGNGKMHLSVLDINSNLASCLSNVGVLCCSPALQGAPSSSTLCHVLCAVRAIQLAVALFLFN